MNKDFSPFNRWKGLIHFDRMKAIADGNFMPPYWIATDPSNACNSNCFYCNTKQFRENSMLTEEHLLKLADLYKVWGVKSTIIEGGGEPLMNPYLEPFFEKLKDHGIEIGIITNGIELDKYIPVIARTAKWIGISFDASRRETYKTIRGIDKFNQVIGNIGKLVNLAPNLDIKMKFLINQYNQDEILDFVKLAKSIGVKGAHIKPTAWEGVSDSYKIDVDKGRLETQFKLAMAEETENFKVSIVTYKFDFNYRRIVTFDKCRCTPLGGVMAADGYFYLCYNMRGKFKLCKHFDVMEVWGSKAHKDLIDTINPVNCMRCGLIQYNEMIENAVLQDNMFRWFP